MREAICKLGKVIKTKNEYGDVAENTFWTTTYCKFKSVTRNEFYQATSVGYIPSMILEVREEDYEGQSMCEYDNVVYHILKEYRKGTIVELTLTKEVHR